MDKKIMKIVVDEDGSYIGVQSLGKGYTQLSIISYDTTGQFPLSETYQSLTREERLQLIKALQEAGE